MPNTRPFGEHHSPPPKTTGGLSNEKRKKDHRKLMGLIFFRFPPFDNFQAFDTSLSWRRAPPHRRTHGASWVSDMAGWWYTCFILPEKGDGLAQNTKNFAFGKAAGLRDQRTKLLFNQGTEIFTTRIVLNDND